MVAGHAGSASLSPGPPHMALSSCRRDRRDSCSAISTADASDLQAQVGSSEFHGEVTLWYTWGRQPRFPPPKPTEVMKTQPHPKVNQT